MTRIADNKIIIEVDHNNKQLVDTLVVRGVPQEQIILGYMQEQVKA